VAYYEEDQVHRLITNLAQWKGDGVGVPGCGQLWDEEKINARDTNREWRSSFRIPAIGIDAEITERTLARLEPIHRAAVWIYHTSSLTFELQAKERMSMAKSTYHQKLVEGHSLFMDAYTEEREISKGRVHAYAQSAGK
jgi:hypothetical protein